MSSKSPREISFVILILLLGCSGCGNSLIFGKRTGPDAGASVEDKGEKSGKTDSADAESNESNTGSEQESKSNSSKSEKATVADGDTSNPTETCDESYKNTPTLSLASNSYENAVFPLMKRSCYLGCHNGKFPPYIASAAEMRASYSSMNLLAKVGARGSMPPSGTYPRLSSAEVNVLRKWQQDGFPVDGSDLSGRAPRWDSPDYKIPEYEGDQGVGAGSDVATTGPSDFCNSNHQSEEKVSEPDKEAESGDDASRSREESSMFK